MHLPSRGARESGNCASFSPAGRNTASFPKPQRTFFLIKEVPKPKYLSLVILNGFLPFIKLTLFSHICVGTNPLSCSGTRESSNSPLVNHCVRFHCVFFMHMCFYDNSQDTKKERLNRKIFICQQATVLSPILSFPDTRNSLSRSQRLNNSHSPGAPQRNSSICDSE